MIEPGDIDTKVKRLLALLKEKFRIDTEDLSAGLKKAGRRLPRAIHKAGAVVVDAQVRVGHPKLARLADGDAVQRAFARVETYLDAVDVKDRRKGAILGVLGVIAFNLIVVFVIFMAVLYWRGLV